MLIHSKDCMFAELTKKTNTGLLYESFAASGKEYLCLQTEMRYSVWQLALFFKMQADAVNIRTHMSLAQLSCQCGLYQLCNINYKKSIPFPFNIIERAMIFESGIERCLREISPALEFCIGRNKMYCSAAILLPTEFT